MKVQLPGTVKTFRSPRIGSTQPDSINSNNSKTGGVAASRTTTSKFLSHPCCRSNGRRCRATRPAPSEMIKKATKCNSNQISTIIRQLVFHLRWWEAGGVKSSSCFPNNNPSLAPKPSIKRAWARDRTVCKSTNELKYSSANPFLETKLRCLRRCKRHENLFLKPRRR